MALALGMMTPDNNGVYKAPKPTPKLPKTGTGMPGLPKPKPKTSTLPPGAQSRPGAPTAKTTTREVQTLPNTQDIIWTTPDGQRPPTPTKQTGTKTGGTGGGAGAGAGGAGGAGGGGGGGGVKNSTDKPQLASLKEMLDKGFAAQRDAKLSNARTIYTQQDTELLASYNRRMEGVLDANDDNLKTVDDAGFRNITNRARETMELMDQAASQGAGETDTLRTQLMAMRNWSSNQADVNRSFYDTQRSINNSIVDLNADARSSRINLATESISDQEQIHANYYNQRADAWTQMGNIHANPYSDSHDPKSTAYANVAKETASHWTHKGVNESLRNWQGTVQPKETQLNNSLLRGATTVQKTKKPEGSTLRKW